MLTFLTKVEVLPVALDQYPKALQDLLLWVITFRNYRMSPYHAAVSVLISAIGRGYSEEKISLGRSTKPFSVLKIHNRAITTGRR
jgi:hypothetical protein